MKLSLFRPKEKGQNLVELGIIFAGIAILAVLTYPLWGPSAQRQASANQAGEAIVDLFSSDSTVAWTILQPGDLKNGVPMIPWKIDFEGLEFRGLCIPGKDKGPDMYWFNFRSDDGQHANRYGFPTQDCKPPNLNSFIAAIDAWIAIAKANKWPDVVVKGLEGFGSFLH